MIRLVSFRLLNSTSLARPGLLLPSNKIIDIFNNDTHLACNHNTFYSKELFEAQTENNLRNLINKSDKVSTISLNEVQLLPPIPPRRNVFCVGKNYMDHVKEIASVSTSTSSSSSPAVPPAIPKYPQFFTKVPECAIGHKELIPSHKNYTKWLDYEAELAVVIGTKGCDITVNEAMNHVFGYMIANDVTARDVQKHHVQFFKGKSLDGTCPLGPALVHKSAVDASNLAIRCWVNGELRQDSRTSEMIFDIPNIIAQLSRGMTLYPGDIILTGTPSGVGYAMQPPKTLQAGDNIRIEIEGLGTLENSVI
jgi:2-keto-4-pentenoate hydratase/2-oxohepta-3-ene-1,7-dioic acid hydratase in catechol pathway